jgi:serine/threonine protein phosphatase PrpC
MAENYFGLTDVGKIRGNNEDTFIAQPTAANRFVLACVIDGVGGYSGGEVAADLARQAIIKEMNDVDAEVIPAMIASFRTASRNIYTRRRAEKELESMACVATLAMVDIANNQFYYAHVGDTRLYLLRDGSLVKISKDHSFVGFLEDSGRLTESAAMSHPKRNEINKALGFDVLIESDDAYIETGQSPFLPGDLLLLCSDGLSDMVDKSEMISIITKEGSSLQEKAALLVESANKNGGKDNITVVLVQNDKKPQTYTTAIPKAVLKKKSDLVEEDKPAFKQLVADKPTAIATAPVKKTNNSLTIFLAVLCLLLLASSVWFYMQWQAKDPAQIPAEAVVKRTRNTLEIKLQEDIDKATGDTLLLSDSVYKQPVLLTDTIHIKKDTLYIKGNVVIQRDSSYTGPALVVAANCKSMVLEGLTFKDFNTAIHLHNNEFYLRKVQFKNCVNAIQNVYVFDNNKLVTSVLPYITYRSDSIKISTAKPNGTR